MAPALKLPPPRKVDPASTAALAPPVKPTGSPSSDAAAAKPPKKRVPSYEDRCRAAREASRKSPDERKRSNLKLFVPRSLEDFDDGGAFPEIHVAQYPRHMGNPHLQSNTASGAAGAQSTSRQLVQVQVDASGDVSYDAVVKGGTNADKRVYTKYEDMVATQPKQEDVALPTDEEEAETTAKTAAALNALLSQKTALDKPSGTAVVNAQTSQNQEAKTQFIKYTPNPDAPGFNPAAAQRVIQMVPKQVDPMMPPKHKHIKAPRGPAEDPVPVLHAPPRKLTKEERDAWNIPSCISNWKNTRGYTIPLDKRLAADGRGLREHSINPNFATLSESLYVAERQARQEVRVRAQVQKTLALQEKEKREEELRQLAQQARLERSGLAVKTVQGDGIVEEEEDIVPDDDGRGAAVSDDEDDDQKQRASSSSQPSSTGARRIPATDDEVAAQQRERLRLERKREREKELRAQSNMELKKQRLEEERDVSEKIALGVHAAGGAGGQGQVDARLYNQSGGMDSGFGADDEYTTYTKPLFGGTSATSASIYRPTRGETEYNADSQYESLQKGATTKFQADKGFSGAEGGGPAHSAGPRTAPVQFEKK